MRRYIFARRLNDTEQEGIVYFDKDVPKCLCFCPKENAEKIIKALDYYESQHLKNTKP